MAGLVSNCVFFRRNFVRGWVNVVTNLRACQSVGFVEGRNLESGIRNPECGIRNPFNAVTCWSILYSFILSLLAETQFALQ